MGAIELRNKLIKLIKTADEKYLKSLYDFAAQKKIEEESDIVAYTIQGEPLTKEMYIKKVKKAESSVNDGRYTTVEDLEKEAENW